MYCAVVVDVVEVVEVVEVDVVEVDVVEVDVEVDVVVDVESCPCTRKLPPYV